MDDRFIAKQIAIGRFLFGALMLFWPRLILTRSAPAGNSISHIPSILAERR